MTQIGADNYNPDVLSCLANLSSDEVFTPPKLANSILDLLPGDIWCDEHARFLDPFCKTGVFLREIAKRLDAGLEKQIPDRQERINHIFGRQLFGIAITELTSLLSRRSVYCSKTANGKYSVCETFDNPQGNIRFERIAHTWKNGRCIFCGASEASYERGEELETHAYEFIHIENPEEVFCMKFDVIIGNPPYQLSDGGAGASAMPIYQKFVEQAKKLNPRYLTMIIPARWYAGGRGLDAFRKEMKEDKRIKVMMDYPKSRECFQGVDIAGGICYFLWERDYSGDCDFTSITGDSVARGKRSLNEFNVIIRSNVGADIIRKIKKKISNMMSHEVLKVSPFGLRSYVRGKDKPFRNCIAVITSGGKSYIPRTDVVKNEGLIDTFKLCIGYLNPDRAGVNNAADGMVNVTTKQKILSPGEVVTETYIIPYVNKDKIQVLNAASYLRTKFVRFLIWLTLSSMHIAQNNFQFVPMHDFSEAWTDEKLYNRYRLTSDEIAFIESMIRPMPACANHADRDANDE